MEIENFACETSSTWKDSKARIELVVAEDDGLNVNNKVASL
jgi:hypothetical protein